MSLSWQHCTHLYYSPLSLWLQQHTWRICQRAHTHTGISGLRPIRGGVRPSLSLIGLDHDISLTGVSFVEPQSFWVADTFFSFFEWLDAPVRPGIFVSRTREKLGRTCDQIGRTLEPCDMIFKHFWYLYIILPVFPIHWFFCGGWLLNKHLRGVSKSNACFIWI